MNILLATSANYLTEILLRLQAPHMVTSSNMASTTSLRGVRIFRVVKFASCYNLGVSFSARLAPCRLYKSQVPRSILTELKSKSKNFLENFLNWYILGVHEVHNKLVYLRVWVWTSISTPPPPPPNTLYPLSPPWHNSPNFLIEHLCKSYDTKYKEPFYRPFIDFYGTSIVFQVYHPF